MQAVHYHRQPLRKLSHPLPKGVLQPCTQTVESEEEDECHDAAESRQCRQTSGENAVNGTASTLFAAFAGLHHALTAQSIDKGIAHFGQCCRRIKMPFTLQNV